MTKGRNRGFALIQALLVVALMVAVVGTSMAVLHHHTTAAQRSNAAEAEAEDLLDIAHAVQDYIRVNGPGMSVGEIRIPTINSLRTLNGLAPTTAVHFDVTNVTPMAQRYSVWVGKDADNEVHGVVFDTGAVTSGLLSRAGIDSSTGQAFMDFKQDVAAALANRRVVSGVIPAASRVARGISSSFSYDLADLIGSAPDHAAVVAFVGFSKLSLEGDLGDTHGGSGSTGGPRHLGECTVQHAMGATNAVCPAGLDMVAQWPHCGEMNPVPNGYTRQIIRNTDYGPLALNESPVQYNWAAGPGYLGNRATGAKLFMGGGQVVASEVHSLSVVLNAALLEKYQCREITYGFLDQTYNCHESPIDGTWWTPNGTCTVSNVYTGGATGNDALCCH